MFKNQGVSDPMHRFKLH